MRVLLCDDHELFLVALSTTLARRGHEVVAALTEPGSVVELVETAWVDCCVLDLDLAGESGLDVAEAVRERCPEVAVLLLSGAEDAAAWDAFDRGVVDGLVSKTCAIDVLEQTMERLHRGERVSHGWNRTTVSSTPHLVEPLTSREREVLDLILAGATTKAMSQQLGVSTHTVRSHVQNVMRKLEVHHRTMAAQRAVQLGLVG